MHKLIWILMMTMPVLAYKEGSFADELAETFRILIILGIFGGFPVIIGLAICLVVWLAQISVKGATKIPNARKPRKKHPESKWDRLEH